MKTSNPLSVLQALWSLRNMPSVDVNLDDLSTPDGLDMLTSTDDTWDTSTMDAFWDEIG